MRLLGLLLLLLCLPLAAQAAIGIGTPCTGFGAGTDTLSVPCAASGTNRAVVAGVNWYSNDTGLSTITYGGAGLTLTVTSAFPAPDLETRQYYLVNPATGSQSLVATFGGSVSGIRMGVLPLTDVHQSVPIGTPLESHAGGITSRSLTVTTAAGELVVDTLYVCTDTGLTVGANQTDQYTSDPGSDESLHASTQAGVDGGVMSWSWSNSDCGMIIATPFKPVAAGAGRRRVLNVVQ
jgi:hypothetical protein